MMRREKGRNVWIPSVEEERVVSRGVFRLGMALKPADEVGD